MTTERFEYELDTKVVTQAELIDELNNLWAQLADSNSEVSKAARAAGLDVSDIAKAPREQWIGISSSGKGLTPETIAIIVAIVVPAAATVAKDVWRQIFLPRIKRKWGVSSVSEKKKKK